MDGDAPTDFMASLEAALLAANSGLDTLWSWLVRIFFVPGDYAVALFSMRAPELATDLGLAESASGGLYAGLLSAACWLAALYLARAGIDAIRNWLKALAGFAHHFLVVCLHRQRMFRRRVGGPARRIRRSLRPDRSGFAEFEIDRLQMAILHEQAKLAPGHVMTALDVADDLRVRPLRAQQALDSLKRLHLVEVSFGTTDGYPGYLLTRPGQVFLASCGRNAAAARPRAG